jgi:hypothetical protein
VKKKKKLVSFYPLFPMSYSPFAISSLNSCEGGALIDATFVAVISLCATSLRAPCRAVSLLREDWNRPSHETEQGNYRNELGHRRALLIALSLVVFYDSFYPERGPANKFMERFGGEKFDPKQRGKGSNCDGGRRKWNS